MKAMTIKELKKIQKIPFISMYSLLNEAFENNSSDVSRVRGKIYRDSKELTVEERVKIQTAIENWGVRFKNIQL